MATFNPTIAGQGPTTTIAPILPNHASGNSSFSASQMLNTHIVVRRQSLNTTSDAATASVSSLPAPGTIQSSLDTSASSSCYEVPSFNASATPTCYEIPSSAMVSDSSVGTYAPPGPSDEYVDNLALIICPALVGSAVLAFPFLMYYQPEIFQWFEREAEMPAKDWWRAFRTKINWQDFRGDRKVTKAHNAENKAAKKWKKYIERRILKSQAHDGTPLTPEQVQKIKNLDHAQKEEMTIWGELVRLIPASGSETSADQL